MADTVIVALPAEDDYVWKISSEKVPHLTLLHLGDKFDDTNLEETLRFVQHIAKTSLCRFGLSVDRRGKLGEKDADVVFFDKNYGVKDLEKIRGYLLTDHAIAMAYNSSEQFPKWIPHLTLGFPDTPAKPDERDYPGLHWVNFDRIAVWTGDYSGPEFRLEAEYYLDLEMSHEEAVADGAAFADAYFDGDIMHYGVKGMRWGVRSADRAPTGVELKTNPGRKVKATGGKFEKPSEDAKRAAEKKQVARKSSTDALSNAELKQLVERMQLEANYDRLVKQQQGNSIVQKLFTNKKFRDESVENIQGLSGKITMPVKVATGVGSTIRKTDLSGIGG